MDAIRPSQDSPGIPTFTPQSGPASPDLVKTLLRWKWLPILGSLVGATVGFLYWGQLPEKYKAVAQIQVVSPNSMVPISQTYSQQMESKSRSDELAVVKSSAVLKKAVELGRLTQHRKLSGKSDDDIVRWLLTPKLLEAKLGSNDLNSDILRIGITTNDAELSGDVVQAVVSGYEQFVTGNLKTYTEEAVTALTKLSDKYEMSRKKANEEASKVKKNNNLIFKNGKPHDPVADTVLDINEKLRVIDGKRRSIEAVLKQVEDGKVAKRPVEQLLRLVISATDDSGFKDDSGLKSQQDYIRGQTNMVELFEQEKVSPLRSQLLLLNEQSLGDSHPSVMVVKQRLANLETELARQKARLKVNEEEFGSNKVDIPTLEGRLNIACGSSEELLQKLKFEQNEYRTELESLRPRMQENAASISNYALSLADLEALSEFSTQITDSLTKINLGSDIGRKTVVKLDMPTIGLFDGPHWYQFVGIGGMFGFACFSGLAYLLELADRSYRNPDEIAMDLGMPILGHVPLAVISRTDRIDDKVDSSIVTLHKNRAPISEAFRGIRTALFFSCQQSGVKVLQVTSPVPGDGKSTIAANIAVSIAQSGRRVCLVDCDFRRPRVAKIFGLAADTGFVQVIGGKVELQDAIQQTTVENLSALICGRRPANPAELLSSELFGDLVSELRSRFDFVIIDTPPMLAVSDPANVASHVDGVLLAIRLRRNLRPIASRAAQMLHAINANMVGVVVNGIGVGGNSYGYGGYRYDNYSSGRGAGYGKSGFGGYGYGSTYQYGGYYGGNSLGNDYFQDSVPKSSPKKLEVKS
ncbi:MAG: polysaccharide biosynthesis tyrosine autokinase [Pirellula sp.]